MEFTIHNITFARNRNSSDLNEPLFNLYIFVIIKLFVNDPWMIHDY